MHERFVAAFNDRKLEALGALLADDATAVVVGAPFPVERGADTIREGSLRYLLDGEPLRAARAGEHVLLTNEAGRLDVAIAFDEAEGKIAAMRYVTEPHDRAALAEIARAAGLSLAPDA